MPISMAILSCGWRGTCNRKAFREVLAGLILEQVDRMGRMVPQQMVRPTARLAGGVHVGATKEIGLHVHLLDLEFAVADALVHPLVARIETARMTCSPCRRCIWVGVVRMTASARLIPSPRSPLQCGMPYFLATSAVASGLPPISDTTSTSVMRFKASRCF